MNIYTKIDAKPPSIYSDSVYSDIKSDMLLVNSVNGPYSTWLVPVRLATTTQIDLLDINQVIDGVSINVGDRILVKNQIGNLETLDGQLYNGVYMVDEVFVREGDFPVGTVPTGMTIYVSEGLQNGNTFFNCVNGYNDLIGSDRLIFLPMNGISNGALGSIQYNNPLGYFAGSAGLVYNDTTKTLTIGTEDNTSYINGGNQISNSVKNEFNIQSYNDIIFKTGSRGDTTDSTITTSDGNILIDTQGSSEFVIDDNYYTGNISISTGASVNNTVGSITFETGEEDGQMTITSGYSSFNEVVPDTTESGFIKFKSNQILLTTSDILTTIENGGFDFTKQVVLQTVQINTKQGKVQLANGTTILANAYLDIIIPNNKVRSDSIIFVFIDVVSGLVSGFPVVQVISKTALTSFTVRIYNSSSSGIIIDIFLEMLISFIIF